MYKKRNNRSNRKKEINHDNRIIRCGLLMRPVLEQETCLKFSNQKDQQTTKYCKNCMHSF